MLTPNCYWLARCEDIARHMWHQNRPNAGALLVAVQTLRRRWCEGVAA
jgi:hypothetical protein